MSDHTLHDGLAAAAARRPDTPISFPADGETLSLRELCAQARSVAGSLAGAGVGHGDRVGVLCANEADFFRTLVALSMLGAVTCPLPLPTTARSGYQDRIGAILAAARIRMVVVSRRLTRLRSTIDPALAGATRVSTGDLTGHDDPLGTLPEVGADDELIVQFTSGSTAAPKGVRLSHGNVLACLSAIGHGIGLGPDDHAGNWLPLFHDMGLFGSLAALYHGVPLTVWPPTAFARDPARWLRAMAETGVTACALPNFAYEDLVGSVPTGEVPSHDLSRWRVAFNGAEPISVDTVERFIDHFAPAGFRPTAMLPVYGLAEATLPVSFPRLGSRPRVDWTERGRLAERGEAVPVDRAHGTARGIVAVGEPVRGMSVRIVDPVSGKAVDDRRVGEVQITGPAVTAGYLDTDEQPFTPDGWLRTGDLGYRANGSLHITGRLTDMIVIRGDNYYPEDVEAAVRTDPGVYRRRCVAFVEDERMVLVAESTAGADERPRLAERLRARIASTTGLGNVRVLLTGPHNIPRTSSGKLQRLASRSRFGRQTPQEGVRHAQL